MVQSLYCSSEVGDFQPSMDYNHVILSKDTTLLMYFTSNILSHSKLAFDINCAFAQKHGHGMIHYTHSEEVDLDRHDVRWNKVIILHQLISSYLKSIISSGLEDRGAKYLIWLDSDLIIANHTFSFTKLATEHPHADIIISAEVNQDNGLANSGCMMVKVSDWSREFLWQWWTVKDRTDGMDQHVFDHLYRSQYDTGLQLRDHVMLLDPVVINSYFPGLVTHRFEYPILHLAGESNFIRRHIFQLAWEGFQNSTQHSARDESELGDRNIVWPPFGVSRMALDTVDYLAIHREEWQSISSAQHSFDLLDNSSRFAMLQEMQYRIREAQQSLSKFLCNAAYRDNGERRLSMSISDSDMSGTRTEGHVKETSSSMRHDERDDDQLQSDTSREPLPTTCVSLKDVFYSEAVDALFFVYREYRRLLNQEWTSNSNYHETQTTDRLALAQSTLDAGMEVLTVLHFDHDLSATAYCNDSAPTCTSYFRILGELDALVQQMMPLTASAQVGSSRAQSILTFYAFKIAEYRAHYLEHASSRQRATAAWETAWLQWQYMVSRYHYFGTGNAVMHAHEEGLRVVLRLVWLLCSSQQEVMQEVMAQGESKDTRSVDNAEKARGRGYLIQAKRYLTNTAEDRLENRDEHKQHREFQHLVNLCSTGLPDETRSNEASSSLTIPLEKMMESSLVPKTDKKSAKRFKKKAVPKQT